MFWLATAPAPARRWAQRAVTAIDDELTTIPKAPVSEQRPNKENVMGSRS